MEKQILIPFDRQFSSSDNLVSFIGTGSAGGKAQGLLSITSILSAKIPAEKFPNILIRIPSFTVIRTDVFSQFMKRNKISITALTDMPDDRIAHIFQKAELPFEILGDLQAMAANVKHPLAVRSSSLLEDAMYEPFAGIYATKMTPNNQMDADSRFRKLVEAIKFVYASVYFKAARDYMAAASHNIEDEKMAVIIQKVAGSRHGKRFYPELSGVARSYNFYPTGRAKPKQGVVNLALGLGRTIVDGGVSWAYTPAYPKISPPFASTSDMLKQTQNEFWAVNMGKAPAYDPLNEAEYLVLENIMSADHDRTLQYTASTLNRHSGRVSIGVGADGPRIINFSPLLQLPDIPFNNLIKELLAVCEQSVGAPVEIEFAMTFSQKTPHHFSFLQVRPMAVSTEEIDIKPEELSAAYLLTSSENVLGNGAYNSICDIIYVKPGVFEAKNTPKIAADLETFNKRLNAANRPCLLFGFGRWGSSDPWLGIPVNWSQISSAKVIVEATLENMNVELSQGSHFFHNLTSFNVFYFSVPFSEKHSIDWEWLKQQSAAAETEFIRHIILPHPLRIKVDGYHRRGVIYKT